MSRPGDWNCRYCQYLNFSWRDSCQVCGSGERSECSSFSGTGGGQEVLPGDWYCSASNCGAHNFASRSNCYKCGMMKDAYVGAMPTGFASFPGWKPGDWVCTRCNLHNYASRMECFRCSTTRDY